MLTPVRPTRGEPEFSRRMEEYKQARQDKDANPANWGFVSPASPVPASTPVTTSRARKSQGGRK